MVLIVSCQELKLLESKVEVEHTTQLDERADK
jgi:hypothetical protein